MRENLKARMKYQGNLYRLVSFLHDTSHFYFILQTDRYLVSLLLHFLSFTVTVLKVQYYSLVKRGTNLSRKCPTYSTVCVVEFIPLKIHVC